MSIRYPFECSGIMTSQPFGDFFVGAIPAQVLLDVAYSDRLTAERQRDGTYTLGGSQRSIAERRLREIGLFIDSDSASFPNSIILAANYREDDGLIEEDEDRKWRLSNGGQREQPTLTIPTPTKLAPIIDGQHRLFAFNFANNRTRLGMPILCAVFFDLPKPYQAFLFATINANQRPVSKSLTYELFGYNVEDESPDKWTPEKLAVFLTRKLLTDEHSPFFKHIIIAAENDFAPKMAEVRRDGGWAVSTATVVEGILRLISQNPKVDSYTMGGRLTYEGRGRQALRKSTDTSPLRQLYLSKGDDLIYDFVRNFFSAVDDVLWKRATPESYIRKTVGIQALFDVLRALAPESVSSKNIRVGTFAEKLRRVQRINFADVFFQTSGTGRQRIRNCIEISLKLKSLDQVQADRAAYERLVG
jgi:DNA phosphorothioation-associated DGQHR protein 1